MALRLRILSFPTWLRVGITGNRQPADDQRIQRCGWPCVPQTIASRFLFRDFGPPRKAERDKIMIPVIHASKYKLFK